MTDYNNPNYFIARDGALWFGPTNPEENLHYSKFAGSLDPEGNPIWVLSRTDPPNDAVRATHPHAQGWAEGAAVVEAAKDLYHKLIADTLPERLGLSALLDDYMAGEISALGDALDAAKERGTE